MGRLVQISITGIQIWLGAFAFASEDVPERFVWFRQLAMSLGDDLASGHGEPPKNFSEIGILHEMLKNPTGRFKIKSEINSLCLVPNAPVIEANFSGELQRNYHGARLFAISRNVNHDLSTEENDSAPLIGGRYAILIESGGESAWCTWIRENNVQIILSGIPGFDPSVQPLIYENIDRERIEIESDRKRIESGALERRQEALGQKKSARKDSMGPDNSHTLKEQNNAVPLFWIVGAVILAALIGALVESTKLRRRFERPRKSGK